MRKLLSVTLTLILITAALLAAGSVAFAADVEMTVASDKQSLQQAGQVEFTATITNDSGAELSGCKIEYSCEDSNFTASVNDAIADGASGTVTFTCDITEVMLGKEISFVLIDPAGGELATASITIKKASDILMVGQDGIDVVLLQQRLRDLGYFNYRATGRFLSMTEKAVIGFQQNNGLDSDGRVGASSYEKLFTIDVIRKQLSLDIRTTSGPSLEGTPVNGELADWFTKIDAAFPVGDTVTITDYNTGDTFQMTRTGGVNHADVESPNAEEYTKYIDCFGGVPNWEKRSVLVTIGGNTYAASLFGNQQGLDTITNNTMDGHTCLYFYGSLSDVLGFADKEHDKMVKRAAGEPLQY